MLFTCRSTGRRQHVLFVSKDNEDNDDEDNGDDERREGSTKRRVDVPSDGDVDDWDDSEGESDPCDVLDEAWRLRTASLWGLKQYLNLRLHQRPQPASGQSRKASTKRPRWPLARLPSMASFFRRIDLASGRKKNASAPTPEETSSPLHRSRSMAHRHCLRIRASQARGLLTSHPSVDQVFAPSKSSLIPTNSVTEIEPIKSTANTIIIHNNNNNNNSDASTQTDDESCIDSYRDAPRRTPLLSIRFLDTFRRRKKVLPPKKPLSPPSTPQTGVRLLEVPPHHQPLLHRYGLSQFVLVVDDPPSEVPPSLPPRSVLMKQRPSSKKSVKFQETPSNVRRKSRWIDQLLN